MTNLYVGNLPYTMTDDDLGNVFAEYNPSAARVIFDKMRNRSKGFGFVEIDDDAKAKEALEKLNNTEVMGRKILVSIARPMEKRN